MARNKQAKKPKPCKPTRTVSEIEGVNGPARTSANITPLGQKILDTILDVVVNELGMGFIGWSLGKTKEITAYVARKLGKPNKSIDGGLAARGETLVVDLATKT